MAPLPASQLRSLAATLTVRQLAQRFHASYHRVYRRLARMGVDARPDPACTPAGRTVEQRERLAGKGKCRAICEALGWPEVTRPGEARVLAYLASAGPSLMPLIQAGTSMSLRHLRRCLARLCHLRHVTVSPNRRLYAVAPWLLARRAERE